MTAEASRVHYRNASLLEETTRVHGGSTPTPKVPFNITGMHSKNSVKSFGSLGAIGESKSAWQYNEIMATDHRWRARRGARRRTEASAVQNDIL